jgi:anti-sigma B factor antagonist
MEIEHIGNVTIVRFVHPVILSGTTAEAVSDELCRLVDGEGRFRLILNFGNVRSLTSLMLGKLFTLNKKVQAASGRLAVCDLSPDLQELFEFTRLSTCLEIHADEQNARKAQADLCPANEQDVPEVR